MRRTMTTMVALLGLSAGLSACAPNYDGFDCRMLNETPSGGLCTDQRIEVARGEALVVRLSAQSDSRREYEDDIEIELRSTDPQAVDIREGFGREQTLIGLSLGETMTEIWIDGERVDEVPTRVVASDPSAGRD